MNCWKLLRNWNKDSLGIGIGTALLWSAYFSPRGWEKLAPEARGSQEMSFTQFLREKFVLLSKFQNIVKTVLIVSGLFKTMYVAHWPLWGFPWSRLGWLPGARRHSWWCSRVEVRELWKRHSVNINTVAPACMVHGCKVNPLVWSIFGWSRTEWAFI